MGKSVAAEMKLCSLQHEWLVSLSNHQIDHFWHERSRGEVYAEPESVPELGSEDNDDISTLTDGK